MRLIKMLGLSVAAVAAVMAFVGASSAMATGESALCKVNELKCPAGSVYTGHIEGLATSPLLLSTIANVLCEHSIILGNALGLAKPQVTHLELIDFTGNCMIEGTETKCTVTTTALGLVDLLKTAPNEGTATSLNSSVKDVCGALINCTFGGEPTLTVKGSPSATEGGTLKATKAVLTRTGGICPKEAFWDATYTIILPIPLYVSE